MERPIPNNLWWFQDIWRPFCWLISLFRDVLVASGNQLVISYTFVYECNRRISRWSWMSGKVLKLDIYAKELRMYSLGPYKNLKNIKKLIFRIVAMLKVENFMFSVMNVCYCWFLWVYTTNSNALNAVFTKNWQIFLPKQKIM